MSIPHCFVAYPSTPPSLVETVENAMRNISEGQVVEIRTWKDLSVNGNIIISKICEAIRNSEICICDLTGLNYNVLFELGYAIARQKKIHIILDRSVDKVKSDFERLNLFNTFGYSSYTNSVDITNDFYKESPYNNLEDNFFKQNIARIIDNKIDRKLFYIKSSLNTDASIALSRLISLIEIPTTIDDPSEVAFQSLSWYAQQVFHSCAVISHFNADNVTESNLHNAKASFVSGLAYGFEKPLLMLAHSPFISPIDYKDILKTHDTASKCEFYSKEWLKAQAEEYIKNQYQMQGYITEVKQQEELKNIQIGEYIAEQEPKQLSDYFLTTSAYVEATRAKCSIFIGRKGTGKTANMIRLKEELDGDKRKHVCVITPIGYELEGIIRMLKQTIPKSEKGFLIESFWKFLIYTELIKSYYEVLSSRPVYLSKNQSEEELCNFVGNNKEMILPEFSIRLEHAVNKLQHIGGETNATQQRLKISELLHSELIVKIRAFLGNTLNAKDKVSILVDNLDKAWTPENDLQILSEMLFGLLEVSQRITRDFQSIDVHRKRVNLSLVIFLRNDIYNEILKYAQEKDKLQVSRITWEDPEILLQVLEKRFMACCQSIKQQDQIWDKYFCPCVKEIRTKEYIISSILPRPRDLLYFARSAIASAVNRRHIRIEEEDILKAEAEYSRYAIDTLGAESVGRCDNMEDLLFGFLQENEIVDISVISNILNECNIPAEKLEFVIDLLFELSFLGIETSPDKFEFLSNEEVKNKLRIMERKTIMKNPCKTRKYKINRPFHAYLEIDTLK